MSVEHGERRKRAVALLSLVAAMGLTAFKLVVAIVTDVSRSRALSRAAKEFRSEALEADALHFRTDIWSSGVVIVGLMGVRIAQAFPAAAVLRQADAASALVVAMIVISVSW